MSNINAAKLTSAKTNGLVSLNALYEAAGKPVNRDPRSWKRLPAVIDFVYQLAKEKGLSESQVLVPMPGKGGGTYADPELSREYEAYLKKVWSPAKIREKQWRIAIAKFMGKAEMEVSTPVGDVDILTPDYVVEVKAYKMWKAALGQALAYSYFFPDKKPVIALFDAKDKGMEDFLLIGKVAWRYGVETTLYFREDKKLHALYYSDYIEPGLAT